MAPPNKSLLSDNASEPSKSTGTSNHVRALVDNLSDIRWHRPTNLVSKLTDLPIFQHCLLVNYWTG